MSNWRFPLFSAATQPLDAEAAAEVIRDGWLTAGPKVEAFENRFAAALGVPEAVMVSSGTAALHLALLACGIGPGAEVILPSLTFVSAAAMIRATGALPVFGDVSAVDRPHLDSGAAARLITPATRAVMVMDYSGLVGDTAAYVNLAREHRLYLIEDAAHVGWPGLWAREVGRGSDFTCFSFYATKPFGLGEGGMIVSPHRELLAKTRRWRSHDLSITARERSRQVVGDYDVAGVGFNYRPTEVTAAMGLNRSERAESEWQHRLQVAQLYARRLTGIPGVCLPLSASAVRSAHHLMPLLLDEQIPRDQFTAMLHHRGIQTGRHYPPIHTFSGYQAPTLQPRQPLPFTIDAAERLVSLPLHNALSLQDVQTICDEVEKVAARFSIS